MFGFIKFLQNFIDKLKSNKRAWFTTIFVLSVSGIVLSILFLSILTSGANEEVYKSQANTYKQRYDNFSNDQLATFRKMSVMLTKNEGFIELISQEDTANIAPYIEEKNKALSESGFENLELNYFSAKNDTLSGIVSSVIESKNVVYGMTIMNDGLYYVYLEPIFVDEELTGVLQIRSGLTEMTKRFLNINQEFTFLLEKNLITNIALTYQEGNYDEFGSRYLYNNKIFKGQYLNQLNDLKQSELREFFDNGYIITNEYYISNLEIVDIQGANIGVVLYGEKINKEGNVINIISKITNQVVMVALGLIISVLLFMF